MNKWDIRFLKLAKQVSTWSKDPSTKVGAVIANGKHVVSLGYNGWPKNVEDCSGRYKNRKLKHKYVIHAEENAIQTAAQSSLKGFTIYSTLFPCTHCTSLIIQNEISRVVSVNRRVDKQSINLFNESNTEVTIYDFISKDANELHPPYDYTTEEKVQVSLWRRALSYGSKIFK